MERKLGTWRWVEDRLPATDPFSRGCSGGTDPLLRSSSGVGLWCLKLYRHWNPLKVHMVIDFETNTQIYIASGEIYCSSRRLSALQAVFSRLVRKRDAAGHWRSATISEPLFLNSCTGLHGFDSQRYIYPYIRWKHGQLHYMVSIASGTFIPTYDENMAKVVEGHRRNGDRYSGEYFGDKMHGFGVYHFANGHCYEGSWHEGRKQGFDMYTFRNGEARSGEWDYRVLKNPLPLTNVDVQRVVQAVRKAAEKAMLIPRVEEQVSKLVAAANRAANAARVAAIKAVQNRIDGKFCDLDV